MVVAPAAALRPSAERCALSRGGFIGTAEAVPLQGSWCRWLTGCVAPHPWQKRHEWGTRLGGEKGLRAWVGLRESGSFGFAQDDRGLGGWRWAGVSRVARYLLIAKCDEQGKPAGGKAYFEVIGVGFRRALVASP